MSGPVGFQGKSRDRASSVTSPRRHDSKSSELDSPKKGGVVSPTIPEDTPTIFIRRFLTLASEIQLKANQIIISISISKESLKPHFVTQDDLKAKKLDSLSILQKIIAAWNKGMAVKEFRKEYSYIPVKELESVCDTFKNGKLKHWKDHKPEMKKLIPEKAESKDKEKKEKVTNHEEERTKALERLSNLQKQVFSKNKDNEIVVKSADLSQVRKDVFNIYKNSPQVSQQALLLLIDLLERDNFEAVSSNYLVELQDSLLEEIKMANAQNYSIPRQRLLIRAYGTCLDCILIHSAKSNLNGIAESKKREFWSGADNEIKKLNVRNDEQISDHVNYASQAVQRITTELTTFNDVATRIIKVLTAGVRIAGLYDGSYMGVELISGAVQDVKEAFSYIESRKPWFEDVLYLKTLCNRSLNDPESFRKIVISIINKLHQKQDDNFYNCLIYILVNTIIKSKSTEVQEESLKLLISIDNPKCTSRLVSAYTQLINEGGRLANTIKVIIELQKQCGKISEDRLIAIQESTARIERQLSVNFSESAKPGIQLMKEAYFMVVITFLLRRLSLIDDRLDFGGETIASMLINSESDRIIPGLLKTLSKYSKELLQPNISGQTPLHTAAKVGNHKCIEHFHQIIPNIDLNPHDYKTGNTPLILAAKFESANVVETLLRLGASPTEVNFARDTPLHMAVDNNNMEIAIMLIAKMKEKNQVNALGHTALNNAIIRDNVEMFDLLRHAGFHPAEHRSLLADKPGDLTLLRIAAKKNAQNIVVHLLIEQKKISKSEMSDVAKIMANMSLVNKEKLRGKGLLTLIDGVKGGLITPSPSLEQVFSQQREKSRAFNRQTSQMPINKPVEDPHGNHALIAFARSQNSSQDLKKLTELPRLLNEKNFAGITGMHTAIIFGNKETLAGLLQEGSDPRIGDIGKYNAVHMAVFLQRMEMLKVILKEPKGIEALNLASELFNETPLHLACGYKKTPDSIQTVIEKCDPPKGDCVEILQILIQNGASVTHTNNIGDNILHRAFAFAGFNTIRFLIQEYKQLFWVRNLQGLLPIQYGILHNRMDNISEYFNSLTDEQLLDLHNELTKRTDSHVTLASLIIKAKLPKLFEKLLKLDPTIATKADNTPEALTPLHYAAEEGVEEVIQIYLDQKIPLTATDKFGYTIAHYMVDRLQHKMAELLKDQTALWNTPNQDYRLPLHLAAIKGDLKFVQFILSIPGAKNCADSFGATPFHLACKFAKNDCIVFFTSLHLKMETVDPKDDDWFTPFGCACTNGTDGLNLDLLLSKTNLRWANRYGATPIILAASNGSQDTMKKILNMGGDPSETDHHGQNALHKACANSQEGCVKILINFEKERIFEKRLIECKDLDGDTPVMKIPKKKKKSNPATIKIDLRILELLKDQIDWTAVNNQGDNFLSLVCLHGQDHLIAPALNGDKSLMSKSLDNEQNNLLHKACIGNHIRFIDLLDSSLKSKENKDGHTPFMLAVKLGHCDFAQAVLGDKRKPEDACKTDNEGRNALHLLFLRPTLDENQLKFLKNFLLEYPKAIFVSDKSQQTILHYIALNNHKNAVDIVLGCIQGDITKVTEFIYRKNTAGNTAASVAREKGNDEIEIKLRRPKLDTLGVMLDKNKKRLSGN